MKRSPLKTVLRNEAQLAENNMREWAKDHRHEIASFYMGWMKCCVFLLAQSKDDFKQYVADMKKAEKMKK